MTVSPGQIQLIMDLRSKGVDDMELLSAIERVPREMFVPETFREHAYEDTALPIGHGQTVSQPSVVVRMIEALELGPRLKVLEVGTGSGYQTAVLSHLCRRVYTVERHAPLLKEAEARLYELRRHNVTGIAGDGALGWPEQAPFPRIIVSAAALEVPPALADQLAEGGIMVAPIGDERGEQRIIRVRRGADGFETEDLGAVRFVPLVPGTGAEAER